MSTVFLKNALFYHTQAPNIIKLIFDIKDRKTNHPRNQRSGNWANNFKHYRKLNDALDLSSMTCSDIIITKVNGTTLIKIDNCYVKVVWADFSNETGSSLELFFK